MASLQIRVPIDDTTTLQFAYRTSAREPGAAARPTVAKRTVMFADGQKYIADNVPKQDMLAWVAQSAICDRTREHLGASDKGVILYHNMLFEQMDIVEAGGEPMAIHRERTGMQAFDSRYENYFETLESLAASAKQ
jgi:5,5'-dehydrodivanillate O-demethylase